MSEVATGPSVTAGPGVIEGEPLERLEARICSMAAKLAASTCQWLVLVAEFDRRGGWGEWAMKSCAHWLSWSCSVSRTAAREYVRVARSLGQLPLITAAFAEGRLSYSKVKAITRAIGLLPESTMLEQALAHTAAQLEQVVRSFRRADGVTAGREQDRVFRWFWDQDGSLVISGRLPADEGGVLLSALGMAEHSLGVPPGDECKPPKDEGHRDSEQVTWSGADALVALAEHSLAAGPADASGDDRHLLVIHVDAQVLDGTADPESPAEHRCQLEDGPGLSRETMLRLACNASVLAVVRTSLGPVLAGEQLRLGRKTRQISPALRRALRFRDGGCQHPGCSRRRYLQAHHVVHWAAGGRTDLANLVLLCRKHHMAVHEGGFQVRFDPGAAGATPGGWLFRRPDGVPMPSAPDLHPDDPDDHDIDGTDGLDPGPIRGGWRGEPFDRAESVGVLARAAADLQDNALERAVDTWAGSWAGSAFDAERLESEAFYANVRINSHLQDCYPDLPPLSSSAPS